MSALDNLEWLASALKRKGRAVYWWPRLWPQWPGKLPCLTILSADESG